MWSRKEVDIVKKIDFKLWNNSKIRKYLYFWNNI